MRQIFPILAAAIALSSFAQAGETSKPELQFVTMDLAPYGMSVDEKNSESGLFREINAALSAKISIKIVDRLLPVKRMLSDLQAGKYDCGIFLKLPIFEKRYDPIAEIRKSFDVVIWPRKGIQISKFEDLRGHVLAIPLGSFENSPLSADTKITRILTTGYEQSTKLLQIGRADVVAGTSVSIGYYLKKNGIKREMLGEPYIVPNHSLWLQCAKGKLSADMKKKLREGVTMLKKTGALDRIFDRYSILTIDD